MFQIIKEILVLDKHNLSKYNFFHLLGQKKSLQIHLSLSDTAPKPKTGWIKVQALTRPLQNLYLGYFSEPPRGWHVGQWLSLWFSEVPKPKKSLCNSFQTDTCQWLCLSYLLGFLYIMTWCVISGSSLCNRFPRLILKYSLFNIFFAAAVKSTDQRLVQREKRKLSLQCVQTIRRHQDL